MHDRALVGVWMGGGILAWSLRKKLELAQKKGNAMTEAFPLDVTTEL